MILRFEDKNYVDIDDIRAMRWFEEPEQGLIVVGMSKISVNKKSFDIIERAYVQAIRSSLYEYNEETDKIEMAPMHPKKESKGGEI